MALILVRCKPMLVGTRSNKSTFSMELNHGQSLPTAHKLRMIVVHCRITNSPIADIAVVWAKCDDKQIRGFIVERSMKGFTTPKIEGKFSLRASITGQIALDDVHVPKENLLPKVTGLKVRQKAFYSQHSFLFFPGTLRMLEQCPLRYWMGCVRCRWVLSSCRSSIYHWTVRLSLHELSPFDDDRLMVLDNNSVVHSHKHNWFRRNSLICSQRSASDFKHAYVSVAWKMKTGTSSLWT